MKMEQDKITELLEEMNKCSKKTLLYQRILTGLLCVFVAAVLILVPTVFSALYSAKTTLNHMDEAIAEMETVLESAEVLTEEAKTAVGSVETAFKKVNTVDVETLNEAIADFSDVVESMSNFFGKFRK